MSTFISLVVVGVCVVATTWLVLRDGGKPATETPPDHRERPRPARTPVGGANDAPAVEAEAVAEADSGVEARPPAVHAPPRTREQVTPARRTVRRRRVRTEAPQRIRVRRRDVATHEDAEPVLVALRELPAPQPEAVRPLERVRSGAGVLALVLFVGLSAALVLGAAVVVISSLLEDAVR